MLLQTLTGIHYCNADLKLSLEAKLSPKPLSLTFTLLLTLIPALNTSIKMLYLTLVFLQT